MIMSLDSKKSIRLSHEVARNVLKTSQANAKRDYDMLYKRAYKVGDLVYVLDTAKVKERCKKLKIAQERTWNHRAEDLINTL